MHHGEDFLQRVLDIGVPDAEPLEGEPDKVGVRRVNGREIERIGLRVNLRDVEARGHGLRRQQGCTHWMPPHAPSLHGIDTPSPIKPRAAAAASL
jgi:hypothetical protein